MTDSAICMCRTVVRGLHQVCHQTAASEADWLHEGDVTQSASPISNEGEVTNTHTDKLWANLRPLILYGKHLGLGTGKTGQKIPRLHSECVTVSLLHQHTECVCLSLRGGARENTLLYYHTFTHTPPSTLSLWLSNKTEMLEIGHPRNAQNSTCISYQDSILPFSLPAEHHMNRCFSHETQNLPTFQVVSSYAVCGWLWLCSWRKLQNVTV